jgi:hypothetical protein
MNDPSVKRNAEPPVLTAKQREMLSVVAKDAPSKINHFRKAYEGFSLRSAIVAKCLECSSCDTRAIRECADTACPLLNVRPYQEARINRNPGKAATQSETAEVNHGHDRSE